MITQHQNKMRLGGVLDSVQNEMREKGFLMGIEAAERLGFPRSKIGSSKLHALRREGAIEALEDDGHFYFAVEVLDAYRAKELKEEQQAMQPPPPPVPPSSAEYRVPQGTFALSSVSPRFNGSSVQRRFQSEAAGVALLPTNDEPWNLGLGEVDPSPISRSEQEQEDELDYAAVYGQIQIMSSSLLKKCGITRWHSYSIEEIPVEQMPRVWDVQVKPRGSSRSTRVRVRLEGGSYHAESPALVDHLQSQLAMLQAELAYTQQKASVAIKRATVRKGTLIGKDPTITIPITYEPLAGEIRVASPEFTYDARGATDELAEANYRLVLHSILAEFHRLIIEDRDLRVDQSIYLDRLELFFEEFVEVKKEKVLV